jgi:hypothetical protein
MKEGLKLIVALVAYALCMMAFYYNDSRGKDQTDI